MKKRIYLIIPFLMISLSACASKAVKDAQAQATAAVIYAQMTPIASSTPVPLGSPTMSVYEFGLTQVAMEQAAALTKDANQQSLALTQSANDLALERERLRLEQLKIQATADEKNRQATQAADQQTAIAIYNMQTAQAANAQTAVAAQTQGAATSTSAAATTMVEPTHAIWTQEAVTVQQTLEAGKADEVTLGVQRTAANNMLHAFWPYAAILAGFIAAVIFINEWSKTRVHERDENGRGKTIQKETKDGTVMVNVDQTETGIVKIRKTGEVIRYAPMDPEEQSHINRGRSLADMLGQLPQQLVQTGRNWIESFGGRNRTPARIIRRTEGSLASVIEEADDSLLEEQ